MIETFPAVVLCRYQGLTPERSTTLIEIIKTRAALERVYGALCGLDCAGGVLVDLDFDFNEFIDRDGVVDKEIHEIRELLTKMHNTRAAVLDMDLIDPMDYLKLPPWQADSGGIQHIEEKRCLNQALAQVQSRIKLDQIEARIELKAATDAKYPRGE